MRKSLPDAFIYVKRVKFQVEFPGNQIRFPGSQNPLDRIFHTYARIQSARVFDLHIDQQ